MEQLAARLHALSTPSVPLNLVVTVEPHANAKPQVEGSLSLPQLFVARVRIGPVSLFDFWVRPSGFSVAQTAGPGSGIKVLHSLLVSLIAKLKGEVVDKLREKMRADWKKETRDRQVSEMNKLIAELEALLPEFDPNEQFL
jgi:hypothetical protein